MKELVNTIFLYAFWVCAQDWQNKEIKSHWTFLQSFKHLFQDPHVSATDINHGLPPAWSIWVSPFHFVCELRKQIHQASLNFSWLLFPPNLWVMAHRQMMVCTWFSLHLWQFPLCLLILNWSGLICVFYRALVSSEGNDIDVMDVDVCLCLPQCDCKGQANRAYMNL